MVRSLFRLIAALCLAFVIPGWLNAAPADGLQYDEIVRVVVGGATPPPPGTFAADALALSSPAPVAQAPRRHHGLNLGKLVEGALSGNPADLAGSAAGDVASNAMEARMDQLTAGLGASFAGAMRGLTQGRLERHSFYAGWERTDDIAAQTATIRKCDLHQVIHLDTAKKTYSIEDTSVRSNASAPSPSTPSRTRSETPAPERPGTAVAEFTNVVQPLGSRKLEGLDTTGYDDTSTFSMSQATGSCRDGNFRFHSQTYYSGLREPRLVCPVTEMPRQAYPQRPENFVASGGCRPTFAMHRSGPVPPVGRLTMYSTIAMSGANAPASPAPTAGATPAGFVFLTERGNVHSLTAANASLFEIPADYTRTP